MRVGMIDMAISFFRFYFCLSGEGGFWGVWVIQAGKQVDLLHRREGLGLREIFWTEFG